jgi:hypothetical protein
MADPEHEITVVVRLRDRVLAEGLRDQLYGMVPAAVDAVSESSITMTQIDPEAPLTLGSYGEGLARTVADEIENRARARTADWSPEDFARLAYDAYGKSTGGKNYQGLPMPTWLDLPEPIQQAWMAAAGAVRQALAG